MSRIASGENHMGVPLNHLGYPKKKIHFRLGCSLINHPFIETPISSSWIHGPKTAMVILPPGGGFQMQPPVRMRAVPAVTGHWAWRHNMGVSMDPKKVCHLEDVTIHLFGASKHTFCYGKSQLFHKSSENGSLR
jgi:hypothetical protein